jgi:L-ascorbate metabolism protein UlaG (beta-lactamase superfamily)
MRIPAIAAVVAGIIPLLSAPAPAYVDMTWMSIANMYYEIGPLKILTDGYISRVPQSEFYGGGSGLAQTHDPFKPDVAAVTRVMQAIGGASSVNLLLTGHSHFDHSFDTATWARLTGARVIGPLTTCYQVMAEKISSDRCTVVYGGEKFTLADGVTMRVVRWNHSGDSVTNPEQHNPAELRANPVPDSATGGLRAGVAEDFPNGGGSRGFLFTVDAPLGRLSWYYQNSASPSDLTVPIVIDGRNYGAPLDNLRGAMKDAGLESVDLWIGTGGSAIAQLVAPVLKPKAYLPVHWDGLWGAFNAGAPNPWSDPALERFLMQSSITLIRPAQYMDKWRLDGNGMRPIANIEVKRVLGFAETAGPPR